MGLWDTPEVMEAPELTTSQSIALSMVKQALIDEGYGPFDNLLSIERGHQSNDGDICDDCGKFISRGPTVEAATVANGGRIPMDVWKNACYGQAEWVIDVFYESFEEGTIYRALYGVPREGKPNCWAS